MNDLRLAVRSLRRTPAFTAAAVITLALGIGANTAIFSLVHAVILKPLPFRDPDRLIAAWDTYLPAFAKIGVSSAELDAWNRLNLFQQSAWYRSVPLNLNLSAPGADAQEVHATVISPDLLPLLGAAPIRGRAFRHDEPASSALLSHRLWNSRFAADPAVIGRAISLNGQQFTIAGIMPDTFRFPDFAEIWLAPGPIIGDLLTNPVRHGLGYVARLRPGVTELQAIAALETAARQLAAEHPRTSKGWGTRISSLSIDLTGKQRPALWMLSAAVALVLLIACANVASLLLSRAAGRRKEFAVRLALGANSWRLVRQLLAESLTLGVAGGALGLLLARTALSAFASDPIALEPAVLLFLLAATLATSIVFGLAPILQVLRQDIVSPMKGTRMTGALVIAEFAMAMLLVAGAGLLGKSLVRLLHVDPGFDPNGLLTIRLTVPPSRNPAALWQSLQERVAQLPGSPQPAFANALPIVADRGGSSRFHVPESPLSSLTTPPAGQLRFVSPAFFQAMRIPILEGREFDARDLNPNSDAIVINQAMARRFWPGQSPVGRKFATGLFGPSLNYSTVIGVAGDVKDFGLDSEGSFDLYFPGLLPRFLVVRTAGDPAALAGPLRAILHEIAPDTPVNDVRTMTSVVAASAESRRQTMLLLAAFAALALVLAMTGIYGVTSWAVAQRTREIGIRMALGADARNVRADVLRRGMKLAFAGLAIGIAASLALQRVAASFVFEVSASDPAILAAASIALLATAALACYIPARRASRVNPLIALRWE